MLDKTITSALLNLRAQIIRGKLDGQEHVNTLLVARGVDPAAHTVRAKRKGDAARRGIMRMMVLDAMRDGPRRYRDISAQCINATARHRAGSGTKPDSTGVDQIADSRRGDARRAVMAAGLIAELIRKKATFLAIVMNR